MREQITRDEGTYLLDGQLAVRDANQYLKLGLPEDEGYTTIAGFLMARAGRVLGAGDTVEHGGGLFRVERVEGLRIRRVRLTPLQGREGAETKESPPRSSGAAN